MIASEAESRTAPSSPDDEALLLRRAAAARREPPGQRADGEPGGERDQRAQRLVGDEEEVERPACAGDGEAAPDPADGARERGDEEPGRDRDSGVAVVPVPDQRDKTLEDDAEGDGERAPNACRGSDGGPLECGQIGHGSGVRAGRVCLLPDRCRVRVRIGLA